MPASPAQRGSPARAGARARVRRRLLAAAYCWIERAIPNRYFLLRPRGMRFQVYLNLRESPMMMSRYLGRYEPQKTAFLQSAIKPGMTVVDVGVNKGYYSLLAASLLQGKGRVLSFEPSPENCRWIRRSIAANGYECVSLFEMALSDKEGEITLHMGTTSGSHSITETSRGRTGESITVKAGTLDAVLAEQRVDRVDVVKIDVEGAECLVLGGAAKMLRQNGPMKIVADVHPQYGVNPEEVIRTLEDFGFSVRTLDGQAIDSEARPSIREILASK